MFPKLKVKIDFFCVEVSRQIDIDRCAEEKNEGNEKRW